MELFKSSDCNGRVVQFGNRHGITKVPFWHAKLTNTFLKLPHIKTWTQKKRKQTVTKRQQKSVPTCHPSPSQKFPWKQISPPKAITKSVAEITVMALPLSSVIVRLDTPGRHVATAIPWSCDGSAPTIKRCVCVCVHHRLKRLQLGEFHLSPGLPL